MPFSTSMLRRKASIAVARQIGLQVRDKNIIVEEWPLRLKRGASKESLNILLSSGHVGGGR